MNLKDFLSQKGLVKEYSPDFISEINKRNNLRIIYGETFDEEGHPIDCLKYYLFCNLLGKMLSNKNVEVIILIADLGVYRNFPEKIDFYKELAKERKEFCSKVKKIYNCNFKIELMSDFVSTKNFKERFEKVKKIVFSNPDILELVKKTVPDDKLKEAEKNEYIYSIEEISTILDFDIKVGPPREKLYDNIANKFSKLFKNISLLSAYLYPTYPLGLPYGSYLSSYSIKEYGLTPYKVKSGNMTKNRISLGKTKNETVKDLIEKTQISFSQKKPNPILDIAIISELARQHLENDFKPIDLYDEFYSQKTSINEFKRKTYENLENYILKYFGD